MLKILKLPLIQIIIIGNHIFEGVYSLHSSFSDISNFSNEQKNILSISHNESYLSPNSILISGINHSLIKSVSLNKEYLLIDDIGFNKIEIAKYNSELKIVKNNHKNLIDKIEEFIEGKIFYFNELSLAFLIEPKFEVNFKTKFQKALYKHICNAWKEIQQGNIIQGIEKIKGSGLGLTPSGDDFNTGILYALNLIEQINNEDKSETRKLIYNTAVGKNDISNAMLFHAYKGAYFKQFKDFLYALINRQEDVEHYFKNLINIGETSGSDILAGFFLGIKHFNKTKDDKWIN